MESNHDFEWDKIKSLYKFSLKIIIYNDFYIDYIYRNFAKKLNFNFHKCFILKPKLKQWNKNPSPIINET